MKLLVVNSDPKELKLITQIFKTLGCDITTAERGRDAIEHCCVETFDLIIIELLLADTDALTVCEAIRQNETKDKLPILGLSSVEDYIKFKKLCLSVGMNDLIIKPITVEIGKILLKTFVE